MTARDRRAWLSAALLFLQVPGCSSIRGPTSVSGTVGGSLSVQCSYEQQVRDYPKYWCSKPCFWKIVKTEESDREVKSRRVSIRDHPANLTFTVTLENLREDDAGTYQCGIDTSWLGKFGDPTFPVEVSVTPGNTEAPSIVRPPSPTGLHRTLPAPRGRTTIRQETPSPSRHPRSLLSSVYFLLLVFLEVPLLLSMLSVVLWVTRPQRGSRGQAEAAQL
ncbi:CMRF35-like molecule 6 [Suricata suricatta]|uniref:CD300c molecule n=1 Tax=Suricata suricatta TaxID=37032 RepID=A0A673V6U9_SURSU|nr:CMRF35-like molecule 6 [Suricata suricatta]